LEVYEAQIQWYLENFIIPEDYRQKILEAHRKLEKAYDDTVNRRVTLERSLQRIKELYKWGHMAKDEYLADYSKIEQELKMLTGPDDKEKTLEKLAHFLANVSSAWKEGTQEQRNKMANVLFEGIWIEDNKVAEVKPRDELRPFFQLSYEEHLQKSNKRPRGVSGWHVLLFRYSSYDSWKKGFSSSLGFIPTTLLCSIQTCSNNVMANLLRCS